MKLLVAGGAGYIGSHMVRHLVREGHEVVVYDNLSEGHKDAVVAGEFIQGDLHDRDLLEQTLKSRGIEGVIHFAASALVGESVVNPAKYYQNNVVASLSLFDAMRSASVWRIVFSSTCATYGQPQQVPIVETEPQKPVNPYGFTKLVVEQILSDYAAAYGFGFAALRYFNAAGASEDGVIGEDHDPESHLIPIALQVALGQRPKLSVFGDDYPTPDGTCIRDYIHVDDLAVAHLLALEKLERGNGIKVNLGTGQGNSVLEVVQACREVTGRNIPIEYGPRRPGDPPRLVADPSLAKSQLGWTPKYVDIKEIVRTAWKWHSANPRGYKS